MDKNIKSYHFEWKIQMQSEKDPLFLKKELISLLCPIPMSPPKEEEKYLIQ